MIENLFVHIAERFKADAISLSCAESCTGGRLCSAITALPGASQYFWGGFVVYSADAKARIVGVPEALLKQFGAVSDQVTLALAENTRLLSGTNWSIAITGYAGPPSAAQVLPSGTVFIAVSSKTGCLKSRRYFFSGKRNEIQDMAVKEAVAFLWEELK